jgi:hypothetical protein
MQRYYLCGVQHKGLGDTVEAITTATGIKLLVKVFAGDRDCGCGERKDKLNELVPYNGKSKKANGSEQAV